MNQELMQSLKKLREDLDLIIETDIDYDNSVRDDLSDSKDQGDYEKNLEKLGKSFKDLSQKIMDLMSNNNYKDRSQG